MLSHVAVSIAIVTALSCWASPSAKPRSESAYSKFDTKTCKKGGDAHGAAPVTPESSCASHLATSACRSAYGKT